MSFVVGGISIEEQPFLKKHACAQISFRNRTQLFRSRLMRGKKIIIGGTFKRKITLFGLFFFLFSAPIPDDSWISKAVPGARRAGLVTDAEKKWARTKN